jgi:hypothetical protein
MKQLTTIILIAISFGCNGQKSTDCTFSDKFINKNFITRNNTIHSFKWDDLNKSAQIILKTGEIVRMRRWACTHIGMMGSMMIEVNNFKEENWKNYVNTLVKTICNKEESDLINKSILKIKNYQDLKNVGSKREIEILNSNYPEFYLSFYELDDFIVIAISNYKNT